MLTCGCHFLFGCTYRFLLLSQVGDETHHEVFPRRGFDNGFIPRYAHDYLQCLERMDDRVGTVKASKVGVQGIETPRGGHPRKVIWGVGNVDRTKAQDDGLPLQGNLGSIRSGALDDGA